MARFFSWLFSFSSLLLTLLKSPKSIGVWFFSLLFLFNRTIANNSSNNYDFSFKKWRRQINRHINVYYYLFFSFNIKIFSSFQFHSVGIKWWFLHRIFKFYLHFYWTWQEKQKKKKIFESSKTIIYYISFNFILIHTPVYAVYSNANAFMLKQYVRLQHFVAVFFSSYLFAIFSKLTWSNNELF